MEIPLQLSFRDIPPARQGELEDRIRARALKLERFCDHITSCRVAVERPNQHQESGNAFRVRIDITVPPGHEVVVRKEPGDNDLHSDLLTVVNGAFEAAERQLKELSERQRGEVKTHDEPRALVIRVFRDEGYGFLKTIDGRDVYFHRNAVLDGDFERLDLGTQVRFEETMGEMGPQATSVQIVDKPGATVSKVSERATSEPRGWEQQTR
jgi:cold shock CspA family protein/ribosome-associated translation inhibitor RaiA